MNPECQTQTKMTFDKFDNKFKMYDEQVHRKNIEMANNIQEEQQKPQTYAQAYADVDTTEEFFLGNIETEEPNQYIQWRYEYTGLKHHGSDNYFIWWMQHPKNKEWYTDIQTREQEHLWINQNVFWMCAEATDNLEDAMRALRQNYA